MRADPRIKVGLAVFLAIESSRCALSRNSAYTHIGRGRAVPSFVSGFRAQSLELFLLYESERIAAQHIGSCDACKRFDFMVRKLLLLGLAFCFNAPLLLPTHALPRFLFRGLNVVAIVVGIIVVLAGEQA